MCSARCPPLRRARTRVHSCPERSSGSLIWTKALLTPLPLPGTRFLLCGSCSCPHSGRRCACPSAAARIRWYFCCWRRCCLFLSAEQMGGSSWSWPPRLGAAFCSGAGSSPWPMSFVRSWRNGGAFCWGFCLFTPGFSAWAAKQRPGAQPAAFSSQPSAFWPNAWRRCCGPCSNAIWPSV